ncbi:MAG TPA: hypothetical protein VGA09_06875, partial [Candidatus Binatia bacterium]
MPLHADLAALSQIKKEDYYERIPETYTGTIRRFSAILGCRQETRAFPSTLRNLRVVSFSPRAGLSRVHGVGWGLDQAEGTGKN